MSPAAPRVIEAYRFYCGAVAGLYGAGALLGPVFLLGRVGFARDLGVDVTAFVFFALLWTVTMAFLALVHVAARATPPSPFAWRIHAIVLGLDLTTLILWPLALPLLWQWLKPDVRRYFGADEPRPT
jgi:hypothetical protein